MPGRDFGPIDGGGHMWLGLAFMGASLLFWVGVTALVVWALLRWVAPRLRGTLGMANSFVAPQPNSAIETLRHRYAMGEIDADTFEQMVERILMSEVRERQGVQGFAPNDGPIYTA